MKLIVRVYIVLFCDFLFVVQLSVAQRWGAAYSQKVWEGEELNLQCEQGYILITTANYGKSDSEIHEIYNKEKQQMKTICRTLHSTKIVRDICNNKKECYVSANNALFGDPCPGQDKYLEASFVCRGQPNQQ